MTEIKSFGDYYAILNSETAARNLQLLGGAVNGDQFWTDVRNRLKLMQVPVLPAEPVVPSEETSQNVFLLKSFMATKIG